MAKSLQMLGILSVFIGVIAIVLGIIFQGQNVAFLVGLAFAIAASTNFPILFLTITWKGLTTNGAFYGGMIGLFTAIVLVILSPTVWVEIFKFDQAIFPYKYPGLFSMIASFLFIFLISKVDYKNLNENKFHLLIKQAYLGKK